MSEFFKSNDAYELNMNADDCNALKNYITMMIMEYHASEDIHGWLLHNVAIFAVDKFVKFFEENSFMDYEETIIDLMEIYYDRNNRILLVDKSVPEYMENRNEMINAVKSGDERNLRYLFSTRCRNKVSEMS